MGNSVTNSNRATNPTYRVFLSKDTLQAKILKKDDAYYDFEEWYHKSYEEAKNSIPNQIKNTIKFLESDKEKIDGEIEQWSNFEKEYKLVE